ncbi:hypothetical protein Taro_041277 [Colocasia esculenta]|uniref:USP domain-containing protein n=1 Tax=Colocasia esculenta TaxID=4460 RepID=A0A843WWU8_COLES|nr:hypothetical protein [Colocasia esculenta]
MPSLQVVLLGLPGALQLVLLFFVPAFVFVVRRKWRLAATRREEIRRLVLLASEEAARAEIEATYEYRNRLGYEHSLASAAAQPVQIVKPVCAVCYSPTTTRCSRCKAIVHWRQGHKDECHPPKVDIQPTTPESSSDLSTQQVESSNLCDSKSVTSDANSNETTNQERPVSSSSSYLSTILNEEDDLKAKHMVNMPDRKCSSNSPELSPSSIHSTHTVPSGDGASVHDASTQDNPARHEETCGPADVNFANISEVSKRKLNKSSPSECIGTNTSVDDISSLNNLKEKTSGRCTEEVGCQSGSSLGRSLNDVNDYIVSKPTGNHAEYREPKSECSGHTDSTSSGVSAKEVVSSHANIPKQVHRDILSRNVVLKVGDASMGGFNVSASDFNGINNTELPPKPRATGSVPIAASLDEKSSSNSGRSVSRSASVKVVHASSVHPQDSGTASSISNGSYDLKTSVQRAVQQFKHSKISRNCHQMLFPYDIFVKLYNEKVEMRPSGLINCGNSCYANVVLQCLAFTRPLTSYLLQGLHTKSCPKKEWCFTCEFESLVLKAKQGQSPLSPVNIISQIQSIGSHLGPGREEDAHEFLRYAIDTMQSVCLKEHGLDSATRFAEETTLMQLTFGGYLRSKIKCMRCQSKSERTERMMDLTVEIHGDVATLDEALARFTMTEILDGENKYQCSRCKSYEKAKKRLKILEAPNVLTVVLKRFQSGKFGKLNKAVRFPEFLNLVKYMSGTSDKSPIYRLYAVVVHLDVMNAAFSGHYVCYVMNATGKWYKIDDSTVCLNPQPLLYIFSVSIWIYATFNSDVGLEAAFQSNY